MRWSSVSGGSLTRIGDDCAATLPFQDRGQCAPVVYGEHDDRNSILPREADGRGIHHLEIARQHVVIGERIVTLCSRIPSRIGAVHPVDLRPLEHGGTIHLRGTQRCRRVRGEKRIACAGSENYHAALFHVSDGAAADVRLAHAFHRNRRLHTRRYTEPLEYGLYCERVHDGREHAHVVGGGALYAVGSAGKTAKDIPAADDQTQLYATGASLFHVRSYALNRADVDAVGLAAHQGFARDLEQHSPVSR